MSECKGNGTCLEQCCCTCYDDEECAIPSAVCTCGHRDHEHLTGGPGEFDIYCRSECPHNCELVKCHNYKMCGIKEPKWVLNCDHGMCHNCAVYFGRMRFLDVKDDCPVCMEHKDLIQVSCGKHNVCLDCWKHMAENRDGPFPLKCPLCRESIWKHH